MTELLKQALVLTGWGMGMTFLALGALVLGMYLMTALVKDKNETHTDSDVELVVGAGEDNDEGNLDHLIIENKGTARINDDQNRAAAAAVAIAIALSQESAEKQYKTPAHIAVPVAWDHYVRGRHLSQRSRYEQLRLHR